MLLQVASLFGAGGASDALLSMAWPRLAHLRTLDVRGLRISRLSLETIATATRVTSLDVTGAGSGDEDLKALRPLLPSLERLLLNGWSKLSRVDVASAKLRVLSLAECPQLGDDAVNALWDHCPSLLDLCLYGCHSLTPNCARGLHKDVRIDRVNVSGAYRLGDAFLRLLFHVRPQCILYTNPNDNAR